MDEEAPRLSYKFQRLREQLRAAIASGELAGKLPGERALAKRFRVNAKTLGKALTDLAAEGLLERTIGRGTFVRGDASAAPRAGDDAAPAGDGQRWLLLCRPGEEETPCPRAIRAIHPALEVTADLSLLRPSFLNPFDAVIDMHGALPDAVTRDLLLRGLRLIRYDATPRTYATDAVLLDRGFSAALQTRDLLRAGHRAIVIVDDAGDELLDNARAAVRRLDADATVAPVAIDAILADGASAVRGAAFLCGSMRAAARVRVALLAAGLRVPEDAAVVGVGLDDVDDPLTNAPPRRPDERLEPCSGYAVSPAQVAATIADLLGPGPTRRPAPLWLVGAFVDRGTARAVNA